MRRFLFAFSVLVLAAGSQTALAEENTGFQYRKLCPDECWMTTYNDDGSVQRKGGCKPGTCAQLKQPGGTTTKLNKVGASTPAPTPKP